MQQPGNAVLRIIHPDTKARTQPVSHKNLRRMSADSKLTQSNGYHLICQPSALPHHPVYQIRDQPHRVDMILNGMYQ